MPFVIFDAKTGAQLAFGVCEQLDIEVFGRNNDFRILLFIDL